MSRNEAFEEGAYKPESTVSYGKWLIDHRGGNRVTAHLYDEKDQNKLGRTIGALTWFGGNIDRTPEGEIDDRSNINGGRIFKVRVSKQFQRKGIASAMLDYARMRKPEHEIRHSGALTDEGRAWAEKKA
jgi:GNAT superfamily N-acetyltransferase